MKLKAERSLDGTIIGYSLPPEFAKLNKLIEMQSLSEITSVHLLPPNFEKMKELVEISGLSKSLGFLLPPEIVHLQKIARQFSKRFGHKESEALLSTLSKIQSVVQQLEQESGINTQMAEPLSEISIDLKNNKFLSFDRIVTLISLLFSLISIYPAIKEIYKDWTDDPITEICGMLTELEKEAVKFVEVDNRGGIPVYLYPTGKKSEHYLLNGTQICMVSQPKGNEKRVKVVYQLENHKQITGYVERNKLKRLYKMD